MPHGKRIAELLLHIGAVKISTDPLFTWTSGLTAPIYCDNRMIYSHPDARNVVVEALVDRIRSLHIEPDVIAGTATAAIGWAALVADRLELPFVYVRAKTKEHGARKQIEGDLPEGKDIVLVEDLISTGGSAISSVEALRSEGKGTCADVVAIFTYEFASSREKAQELGVQLHPLSDLATLLAVGRDMGAISEEQVQVVGDFAEDPEGWA